MKRYSFLRNGIYTIEDVLSKRLPVSLKKTEAAIVIFDGDSSYMSSERYEVFDKKGISCVTCGIKGLYFAKEKFLENGKGKMWHFNLYALDENGEEVLMTKDHILAKSKGGKNALSNYQTMCYKCNQLKSDK